MRDRKLRWNGALAMARDEALDFGPLLLAGALVLAQRLALVGSRTIPARRPRSDAGERVSR
jgi:hypothetical protein